MKISCWIFLFFSIFFWSDIFIFNANAIIRKKEKNLQNLVCIHVMLETTIHKFHRYIYSICACTIFFAVHIFNRTRIITFNSMVFFLYFFVFVATSILMPVAIVTSIPDVYFSRRLSFSMLVFICVYACVCFVSLLSYINVVRI